MSINKVILIGRVSNDITINKSQSGTSMCNFSIAVDRYMGKDKERATDFIRCTAFGSTADILGRYAGKGKQVAVEGNIKTGSYERDGVKHYTQDVQIDKVELLGGKGDGGQQTQATPAKAESPTTPAESVDSASSEDCPF